MSAMGGSLTQNSHAPMDILFFISIRKGFFLLLVQLLFSLSAFFISFRTSFFLYVHSHFSPYYPSPPLNLILLQLTLSPHFIPLFSLPLISYLLSPSLLSSSPSSPSPSFLPPPPPFHSSSPLLPNSLLLPPPLSSSSPLPLLPHSNPHTPLLSTPPPPAPPPLPRIPRPPPPHGRRESVGQTPFKETPSPDFLLRAQDVGQGTVGQDNPQNMPRGQSKGGRGEGQPMGGGGRGEGITNGEASRNV